MLKAVAIGKGKKPVLIIGLDAGNVARLRAGEPILVEGASLGVELGVDVDVAISYAESLDQLERNLAPRGPANDAAPASEAKGAPTLVILALAPPNLARLTAGQPLHVDGVAFDVEIDVVLLYAEPLDQLVRDLEAAGVTVPPLQDLRGAPVPP